MPPGDLGLLRRRTPTKLERHNSACSSLSPGIPYVKRRPVINDVEAFVGRTTTDSMWPRAHQRAARRRINCKKKQESMAGIKQFAKIWNSKHITLAYRQTRSLLMWYHSRGSTAKRLIIITIFRIIYSNMQIISLNMHDKKMSQAEMDSTRKSTPGSVEKSLVVTIIKLL